MQQVILLELNEINFEYVEHYIGQGKLPNFKSLIRTYGVRKTTSEARYEDIEPWIQWVTAHTGLMLSEHGVFRLGDIEGRDLYQIWEMLEDSGVTIGAVCPINASNRTKNAKFFIPDPWTNTRVTGSFLIRKLYDAISQAVNENSESRIALDSAFWLLIGAITYARPANYLRYFALATMAIRKSWPKAIFLDLLLSDVFVQLTKRKRPLFATLFLNAGAHIQHHYLFNSPAYKGDQKNPMWYARKEDDPVFTVYSAYDDILGTIFASFPGARFIVATGIHQDPHPETTFYWRLKDHAAFLHSIGLEFEEVLPRMSRDFVIRCKDRISASHVEQALLEAKGPDSLQLFSVDNRGNDLFVMLIYANDIGIDFKLMVNGRTIDDFRNLVSFVAIKNGQHNSEGYLVDSGQIVNEGAASVPLALLPDIVKSAFQNHADRKESPRT